MELEIKKWEINNFLERVSVEDIFKALNDRLDADDTIEEEIAEEAQFVKEGVDIDEIDNDNNVPVGNAWLIEEAVGNDNNALVGNAWLIEEAIDNDNNALVGNAWLIEEAVENENIRRKKIMSLW